MQPGGYIIKILRVVDEPQYERLQIVYDIADGDLRGIYADLPTDEDWKHRISQKYSAKAQPFFKGFLKALERSNSGFSIEEWQKDSDERDLVGLYVGELFRNYHYISEQDGKEKTRVEGAYAVPVETIRKGDYTVPDDRWQDGLDPKSATESTVSDTPDDPFGDPVPF